VGWEALMHAKPVIVLGNVWFDACDLVRKVRALADLPAALRWAISGYVPDEELLLRFVTASLEGTYRGKIEHPDYSPDVLSAENAAAIADAIESHVKWVGIATSRTLDTLKKEPPPVTSRLEANALQARVAGHRVACE
jgi:hypothetical protein